MQFCFNWPFETARVVLGRVTPHDQHHVGVLDVDPAVGHRAASKGGPQTGDRWTVSNPGLRFEVADSQAAHSLDRKKIQLIGISAAADPADRFQTINGVAVLVFLDESFVPGLLGPARNLADRILPGDVIPVIRTRTPHLRLQETTIINDVLFERSAFRTECAATVSYTHLTLP